VKIRIQGNKQLVFYFVYFILIGAVFNRMIPFYLQTRAKWLVIGLLLLYLCLLSTENLITRKLHVYPHIYFLMQLTIIIVLVLIPHPEAAKDYYINLVIPLSGQAIWDLPGRFGKIWVALLSTFCIVSMVAYYKDIEGLSFGLSYVAGCLLVTILSTATQKADRAQTKSQALLAELQTANWKLKEYASQVEKLAITEERNRMARELHDSVSQTIFSMTLTAQAARILLDSDVKRVASLLDHLQTLSQNALAEMRTLIHEFRENSIVENGLIPALQKQISTRLDQDGLTVDLTVTGENRLPRPAEEGLFRIVQEALNNVVKHAKTDRATVTIDFLENKTMLAIEDHGCGFDAANVKTVEGHVGLTGMEERVRALGGTVKVDSIPGDGTRIQIEIIRKDEDVVPRLNEIRKDDPD
jgi:signal transduction histidine kinase